MPILDIFNLKERYERWKKEVAKIDGQGNLKIIGQIDSITKIHSDWIIRHVIDMELGKNTSRRSKRGGRGYQTLNDRISRTTWLFERFEERGIMDITKIKPEKVEDIMIKISRDLKEGVIKKKDGKIYADPVNYTKTFITWWNWYMKYMKKKGKHIPDITGDLDTHKAENSFVYFTRDELEKIIPYFNENEQVMLLFIFDTIMRSPSELMNLMVSDLKGTDEITIRDETSKTYGRTIKLLLCSETLEKYIERNNLQPNDYIFKFSYRYFTKKLQRVAKQVFGNRISKGGKPYSNLSLYDFRHSGACYWRLGAYQKKIDALMYRGGWNNLDILNYYTKKLGMRDSIERDDLLIDVDKNKYEKEIDSMKNMIKKLEIALTRREKLDPFLNKLVNNPKVLALIGN